MFKATPLAKKFLLTLTLSSLLTGYTPSYSSDLSALRDRFQAAAPTMTVITLATSLCAIINTVKAINHLALRQHDVDNHGKVTSSWQAKFAWNALWAVFFTAFARAGFTALYVGAQLEKL